MKHRITLSLGLTVLLLSAAPQAQEHHDHQDHAGGVIDTASAHSDHHDTSDHMTGAHDAHEAKHEDHAHGDHQHDVSDVPETMPRDGLATLTRTDEINAALAQGGQPIVADVLGVVCDFCAIAMNKIFSKREEVAAIYVDLDTKALSLVLAPGATLSDQTIADLAIQAGYRIADIRRDDVAMGANA
jgi:hypothetical protein